jgi:hypothetical protein
MKLLGTHSVIKIVHDCVIKAASDCSNDERKQAAAAASTCIFTGIIVVCI